MSENQDDEKVVFATILHGDIDDMEETDQDDTEPLNIRPEDRKLVTQPYDLGVKGIHRDVENGQIILDVEYQRKYVWDNGKASRFIESLLLNVPIPVVYFAEDESGNYEVIDGLQRLRTIQRFLDGEFALSALPVLKELSGLQILPADAERSTQTRESHYSMHSNYRGQ